MSEPTEDLEAARERIGNESVEGGTVGYEDGTIVEDGRVTKAGPLAIVEDGRLLGWRKA